MYKNRGYTVVEIAIVFLILCLVLFVVVGIPLGGSLIVIAAANLLFKAGWAYDFQHIAIIAAIILLAEIIFGGSKAVSVSKE